MTLLLSARGLDLALPAQPLPACNPRAWRLMRSEPPPAVSALGAALADALTRRWRPDLEGALDGSGLRLAWPMLDETVAHFLANLPAGMRLGRPWSIDFRRRILRDLLPAPLRVAAEAASGAAVEALAARPDSAAKASSGAAA